jgi:poly(beta-D-mannuronate) lyase
MRNNAVTNNNLIRFISLLLLVTGLTAGTVKSEIFHVRSADEANAGLLKSQPGDEIILENGTYPDFKLNFSAMGQPEKPIVFRAETPGQVVLTGQPGLNLTGSYIEVQGLTFKNCEVVTSKQGLVQFDHSSHCRLTGCRFEHINPGNYSTISFRNAANDNRLDHCRFIDIHYRSVKIIIDKNSLISGPPSRNRIDHNLFQDVPLMGQNGAETVQIGQSAIPLADLYPETVVENNLFLRCDGEIEIISVKSSGNIIRNNLFRDCKGEVVNRTGHENIFEGNRFENCTGGIRLSNHGHRVTNNVMIRCKETGIRLYYGTPDTKHPAAYLPVYGCVITNNTVVDCGQFGIVVGINRNAHHENQMWANPPYNANAIMDCTIPPHENRIAKNIITGSKGVLLKLEEAPNNTIKDNLIFATGTATIEDKGEHTISVSPGFINSQKDDYRLSVNSPAKKTGLGATAEIFPAGPDAE